MIQNDKYNSIGVDSKGGTKKRSEGKSDSWHDFFDQDPEMDGSIINLERRHDPDTPWHLIDDIKCENPFG